MEHSKLPHSQLPFYTSDGIENRGVRNADGFICFLRPRPFHHKGQDERYERELREWEGDANFIKKACNEHDTLKAKAELLDEAIDLLITFSMVCPESECGYCMETQYSHNSLKECMRLKAKALAKKAKEIL
jgi:hypothetical protein